MHRGLTKEKEKHSVQKTSAFVAKGETLYATFFAWPESRRVVIKNLSRDKYKPITKAQLLGAGANLSFTYTDAGLVIELPDIKSELNYANVLKLS